MVEFTFRGLMAPVFTPFNNDTGRTLNVGAIPDYAWHLKDNGVEGILVNGTTGEGVSQTVEERELGAEAWIRIADKTKQTIMVQVGGTNLKDVCRLAAHAEKFGASSILCLADLFHRPSNADDLIEYLSVVSNAAPKTPLLYYHIPGFTGININMVELLEKADKVPTFVGIKFTHTDLDIGAACLAVKNGKYAVFLGSDTIFCGALSLGFNSAISTSLNIFPQLNRGILQAVTTHSQISRAGDLQRMLTAAVKAISKHGSWVGTMKSAMNLLSPIYVGPVREPLKMLDNNQLTKVKNDLHAIQPSIFASV